MTQNRRIIIFDTTLRDGEQSPGASMNMQEKLEVAQALVELGVDVIEAGFPIASQGDFEAVQQIATNIHGATICGLARCNNGDIDRAWEALKHAKRPRIHVFLATSAIHREFKLRMGKEEIIERAVAGVQRAASYCDDVEFSPEDAARTEIDFLCQVVEAAIDAIEDETDREVARIEWEYATTFERSHPLVNQIGAALGLTPEQIDAMWAEAATR